MIELPDILTRCSIVMTLTFKLSPLFCAFWLVLSISQSYLELQHSWLISSPLSLTPSLSLSLLGHVLTPLPLGLPRTCLSLSPAPPPLLLGQLPFSSTPVHLLTVSCLARSHFILKSLLSRYHNTTEEYIGGAQGWKISEGALVWEFWKFSNAICINRQKICSIFAWINN